jgi:hypothetical protein
MFYRDNVINVKSNRSTEAGKRQYSQQSARSRTACRSDLDRVIQTLFQQASSWPEQRHHFVNADKIE